MIGVLWWYSVGFPFDIRRDVLFPRSAQYPTRLHYATTSPQPTFRAMKTARGPASVKIPVGFTEVTIASTCAKVHCQLPGSRDLPHAVASRTYSLPTERLPDDRSVLNRIFGVSTGWQNAPLADINHVHHADHEMVSRTPPLLFLIQPVDEIFPHIRAEVGRVQGDDLGLFLQEKHVARLVRPTGWRGILEEIERARKLATVEGVRR